MKHLKYIFAALLLALLIPSCRSKKQETTSTELLQNVDYAAMPVKSRAEMLAQQYSEWTELNVPLKAEFRRPMSISGSGRAYMRRGKDIYISIKVLGIEVATAYIDSEKVCIADKFNRRYLEEPIGSVLGNAKMTVSDIQDILLGRVFVNSQGTFSKNLFSKVKFSECGKKWNIAPKQKAGGATYDFDIITADNLLEALNVHYAGHDFSCDYSDPVTTPSGRFMQEAAVDARLAGNRVDLTLKWNFDKAKYSVSESIRWKTPSGYKKVSASSLLKK